MTTLPAPMPDPNPGEVERGLAALERHLADVAPSAPVQLAEISPIAPVALDPVPVPTVTGETKRVIQLRAEVAEAALLADLQSDDTPLTLDTDRVRRRRRQAHEAARLHQLAQDPVMRAWQAARMRRLLVIAAMVSLALALSWSTAGVQVFASEGAKQWSPGWIFAWFVEPFLSLALLVVVGARAYMGTRGQPIRSKALTGIEALFLTLTLGMNAWRHLPGVADKFSLSALVLHTLGPIVAVAIVMALPVILAAFNGLDHGGRQTDVRPVHPVAESAPTSRPTAREYSGNVPVAALSGKTGVGQGVGALDTHRANLRAMIDSGAISARPSASAIRKALRCGSDIAARLRDELAGGAA